ncbi:LysR family transcriptional regulator [Oceanobacter kriegii]|uniref:LysR family transcriptional regulator n=1 Tax=Oceanobacter kriegii TaxID=64972 RepID=UPI00041FFD61|nr:LysR family transcriptional regulator [Oceanobacter kriegii]
MINNRIKFRHLQCFTEVVNQAGMGRAACNLSLTQPAVSRRIKELEEILDVQLLNRTNQGVFPTEAGQVFFEHVQRSLLSISEGINTLKENSSAREISLTIGIGLSINWEVLSQVINTIKNEFQNVKIRILRGYNGTIYSKEQIEDYDFFIGYINESEPHKELGYRKLHEDEIYLIARENHPLSDSNNVSMEDLKDFEMVLPSDHSEISNRISEIHEQMKDSATGITQSFSDEFSINYCEYSDAICIVKKSTLLGMEKPASVTILSNAILESGLDVALIWKSTPSQSNKEKRISRRFIELFDFHWSQTLQ